MVEEKIDACVRCGYCCCEAPCSTGYYIYGDFITQTKPCPGLVWHDGKHWCKLSEFPGELGGLFRKELYIDTGCCSTLNSWRREPLRDRSRGKHNIG